MTDIFRWLADIGQWLRDAIGTKESRSFEILEHRASEAGDCEAWLLCNEACDCGLGGMVAFWFLRHHTSAEADLIILCFNTAQIREAYQGERVEDSRGWRRKFEVSARLNLKLQADVLSTHLFMVCWVGKSARVIRFVDHKTDYYKQIRCTTCHAVDLQGHKTWVGSNRAASKIVRAIALRCIEIQPNGESTWEDILMGLSQRDRKINWLAWLEVCVRKEIGVEHILQPKKVRLKTRKT